MTEMRYQRSPHAVWRASSSFLVAAVPPHPPTRITGSASAVWALLAQPRTVDEVVHELSTIANAAPERLRADVADLVAQLLPLQLVEVVA